MLGSNSQTITLSKCPFDWFLTAWYLSTQWIAACELDDSLLASWCLPEQLLVVDILRGKFIFLIRILEYSYFWCSSLELLILHHVLQLRIWVHGFVSLKTSPGTSLVGIFEQFERLELDSGLNWFVFSEFTISIDYGWTNLLLFFLCGSTRSQGFLPSFSV